MKAGQDLDAVLTVHQLQMQAAEHPGLVAPVFQLHARVTGAPPVWPPPVREGQGVLMLRVQRVAILQLLHPSQRKCSR